MKKKISLQLTEVIVDKLKTAAAERGVNRAIIVEKALERFLDEADGAAMPVDRIERLDEQLKSIQSELKAISETVTLHARYDLAARSLMRGADQSSSGHLAGIAGQARSEHHPKTDTDPIDSRRGASRGDTADDVDMEQQFGAPTRSPDRRPWANSMPEVAWGLPGAAEEGGSEDYFRGPQR
jgi:hypothetical protein